MRVICTNLAIERGLHIVIMFTVIGCNDFTLRRRWNDGQDWGNHALMALSEVIGHSLLAGPGRLKGRSLALFQVDEHCICSIYIIIYIVFNCFNLYIQSLQRGMFNCIEYRTLNLGYTSTIAILVEQIHDNSQCIFQCAICKTSSSNNFKDHRQDADDCHCFKDSYNHLPSINGDLAGGFKTFGLFSISYMGCHPSH